MGRSGGTLVGLALLLTAVRAAPVSADADATIDTLLDGLMAHYNKIQQISGKLLVNTWYSEEAMREAAERYSTAIYMQDHPDQTPTWSPDGAIYCEFHIDGLDWCARSAHLKNSGFGELSLPGICEADDYWPESPPLPWCPPQVLEYCDANVQFRYLPHLHEASYALPSPEWIYSGQRRYVLDAMLESCGEPMHKLLLGREGDRDTATLDCVAGEAGSPHAIYRLSYRTGPDRRCRATAWVECRGSDFRVTKMEDYWLRTGAEGYRRIAEVQEVTQLPNGAHAGSLVVEWSFLYRNGVQHAWQSTTAYRLSVPQLHEGGLPDYRPWEWLPLGTFATDPLHLAPRDAPLRAQSGFVGDLSAAWERADAYRDTPPPFDPAWDRPVDAAARAAHAGPCELEVTSPRLRVALPDDEPAGGAR